MTGPQPRLRRGQPLAALAVLLLGWGGVRAMILTATADEPRPGRPAPALAVDAPMGLAPTAARLPADRPALIVPLPVALPAAPAPRGVEPALAPRLIVAEPAAPLAPDPASGRLEPRIAAGHQLLFLAGLALVPLPEPALAARVPAPPGPVPRPAGQPAWRWSGDGWILWRSGGNGFNLPGAGLPGAGPPSGVYGASQAGVVLRYRLAPASGQRPALYLRATSALARPRGEELAAGVVLRPLPRLPVSALAEARVTRHPDGTRVRPALAMVSEVPPVALPLGLRGEFYGQAGWVGGRDQTPFIDGQLRLERAVVGAAGAEFRLGAGAWGGAQRGTGRIDLGPAAGLDLPLGPARARLTADYRVRVAGAAAPGSGLAVTFSAGF